MAKDCAAYAEHLQQNQAEIEQVMTAYQSNSVTADEIKRSVECLTSLGEIEHYLNHRTRRVCTFFPLNLPIYSLVLFAVIPSLVADEVFLRPPQKMIPVFTKLLTSLSLPQHFPNIHVCTCDREKFVGDYVADADVTIFTGKESNARDVFQKTKKDSVLLFNGWGCNPIVVGRDADIQLAATKSAEAKLFNSGQDCAGPDNILVHRDVAEQFLAHLRQLVERAKVGDYSDPEVVVGKIAEESALVQLASFLVKHQNRIIYGGMIDFPKGIVYPTIIVEDLAESANYDEFFSPIFYINIYDHDAQLATYFDHPRYATNDMYVSLFGTSAYVDGLKRSIVLKEQTILDVERGNSAYGGNSFGASFVATGRKIEARPILVPKEISQFVQATSLPSKLSPAKHKRIHQDFTAAIQQHFTSNLIFGFIYGSIARGTGTASSDIDTFILTHKSIPSQTAAYLSFLRDYHTAHGLNYDSQYPAEILTLAQLSTALDTLDHLTIDLHLSPAAWDATFWTTALCGVQRGIAGDRAALHRYARNLGRFPKAWKEDVLRQVEARLRAAGDACEGLSEGAVALAKLARMPPDQVLRRFAWQNFGHAEGFWGALEREFGAGVASACLEGVGDWGHGGSERGAEVVR
jgi:predicted nucleotidyltransferase